MTSGAVMVLAGMWIILQVTKGGLLDRVGG